MKIKPTSKPGQVVLQLDSRDDRLMESSAKEAAANGWPFQLKKILVPTDFSVPSLKALDFAVPLAEKFGATIILLHVLELSTYPENVLLPGELEQSRSRYRQEGKMRLDALARDKIDGEVSSVTLVAIGKPHEEIIQAAKSMRADMIVIATHGYTGLKHILLGSTAEKVVRQAECPVISVRAAGQGEQPSKHPIASKLKAEAVNPVRNALSQVGSTGSWPGM